MELRKERLKILIEWFGCKGMRNVERVKCVTERFESQQGRKESESVSRGNSESVLERGVLRQRSVLGCVGQRNALS